MGYRIPTPEQDRRDSFIPVRMTDEEKYLARKIAEHEERTLSDSIRRLIKKKAKELGITV